MKVIPPVLTSLTQKNVIEPVAMTLEEAFGSVKPITHPENFKAVRAAALTEKAEDHT
jgi:hypothetical protein